MEHFVVDVLEIVGGPKTGACFLAKIVPRGPMGSYKRFEPNKRCLSFKLKTVDADSYDILVLMKINRYMFAYASARLSIHWFAKNSVTTELFPIETRVPPYESFFIKLRIHRMSTEHPVNPLPTAPLKVIPTWLPGKKEQIEPASDPYKIPIPDYPINQFQNPMYYNVPVYYPVPIQNPQIEKCLPDENPYEILDINMNYPVYPCVSHIPLPISVPV